MTDGRRAEEDAGSRSTDSDAVDLGRRSFFRMFGREAIRTAATVAGTADAVRRGTTAAGAEIIGLGLGTPGALERLRTVATDGAPGERHIGFHSPYRIDQDELHVLDQRRLPDGAVEIAFKDGYSLASALRDYAAEGAPLLGQLAAYGLALTASQWREASVEDRNGRLRVAAAALRDARAAPANLGYAVDRLERKWHSVGEEAAGGVVADALRADADAIATEATLDLARMGRFGAERLRRRGGPALAVLTHGSVGALAGGSVGTALGVVQALIADGQDVEVLVAETRPALLGARLTAWELAQAGIAYRIVADGACGWLLESGRVDVVLVGAERIAANGDTLNTVGTYPLAVLATRHGVPFYVCAPGSTFDLEIPDRTTLPEEMRPAGELTSVGSHAVVPTGARVLSPGVDVTPAELITAFITDEGVLEQPFVERIASATTSRRPPAVSVPA